MTDLNLELLERGIVILPEVFMHEDYQKLAQVLLLKPDHEILLFCAGDGGSARDCFATIDLIQAHGKVVGMLAGAAVSVHGVIWSSCAKRYVYPNAMLGVHKVGYTTLDRPVDTKSAMQVIDEMAIYERYMAQIYATASNHDVEWWSKVVQEAGSSEFRLFTSAELVSMNMANPIGDFISNATLEMLRENQH